LKKLILHCLERRAELGTRPSFVTKKKGKTGLQLKMGASVSTRKKRAASLRGEPLLAICLFRRGRKREEPYSPTSRTAKKSVSVLTCLGGGGKGKREKGLPWVVNREWERIKKERNAAAEKEEGMLPRAKKGGGGEEAAVVGDLWGPASLWVGGKTCRGVCWEPYGSWGGSFGEKNGSPRNGGKKKRGV